MPTYEYLCQSCNNRFEIWQKMTDEPLTICAECGGHIRRVIYPAGIVFKGSGFYKTDHGAVAGTNGSSQKGESKPAETKTGSESKPAESSSSNSSDDKVPASTDTKS